MAPLVYDETWRQMRLLTMLVLAAMIGTQLMPALRPYRRMILGGLLGIYLLGGAAVLGGHYFAG